MRHTGEQRHLAVNRGLLYRNDKGEHARGALRVGNGLLARRARSHMRVNRRGLVGFKGAKDIAGDQVTDMANVVRD
jgi:hypothetical protein